MDAKLARVRSCGSRSVVTASRIRHIKSSFIASALVDKSELVPLAIQRSSYLTSFAMPLEILLHSRLLIIKILGFEHWLAWY